MNLLLLFKNILHRITCPANVCSHKRTILRGSRALKDLCDHNLWAPIVTPIPDPYISENAESERKYSYIKGAK